MTVTVESNPVIRYAARLDALSGEGALDVFVRARTLEAQGREIVHLELGEPDAPTPAHVIEATVRALRDGETRYSQPAGLPELREAVAASAAERGVDATAADVVVTPSAKTAVFYSLLSLVAPGDEVLVPDPGFPIFPSVVRFCGGTPVSYSFVASRGYAIDVEEVATRLTPRTRVLVLNAPSNPTGGSIDGATIERLAELAERHDLAVVSDEIYSRLTYDEGEAAQGVPSVGAHPALRPRSVLVNGFSKTYAMPGFRLGYAIVPPPLVERFTTLAINGHTCTPVFTQRAGIAALTGPQDAVSAARAEYRARRDVIVRGLNAIPGVRCPEPRGAFYAFPDLSAVLRPARLTVAQFVTRLLEEFGVAALQGTAFGARGEGHLRISFASGRADIDAALRGIAGCVAAVGK
ncbi:MAG: pyridoxal phosphate-dependent aminotransferase [Gemmatimonadaceae bacterium]